MLGSHKKQFLREHLNLVLLFVVAKVSLKGVKKKKNSRRLLETSYHLQWEVIKEEWRADAATFSDIGTHSLCSSCKVKAGQLPPSLTCVKKNALRFQVVHSRFHGDWRGWDLEFCFLKPRFWPASHTSKGSFLSWPSFITIMTPELI